MCDHPATCRTCAYTGFLATYVFEYLSENTDLDADHAHKQFIEEYPQFQHRICIACREKPKELLTLSICEDCDQEHCLCDGYTCFQCNITLCRPCVNAIGKQVCSQCDKKLRGCCATRCTNCCSVMCEDCRILKKYVGWVCPCSI